MIKQLYIVHDYDMLSPYILNIMISKSKISIGQCWPLVIHQNLVLDMSIPIWRCALGNDVNKLEFVTNIVINTKD